MRYPVVVRFDKVNYAGYSTNNYAISECQARACQKRRAGKGPGRGPFRECLCVAAARCCADALRARSQEM